MLSSRRNPHLGHHLPSPSSHSLAKSRKKAISSRSSGIPYHRPSSLLNLMSRTGPGLDYGIPRRLLIRGMLRTTSEPFLPSGWSDGPFRFIPSRTDNQAHRTILTKHTLFQSSAPFKPSLVFLPNIQSFNPCRSHSLISPVVLQ